MLLIIGIFLFSTKGIFIKLAYQHHVEPTVLMTIRMLLALPFYLIVLVMQLHKQEQALTTNTVIKVLFIGLFGYYLASWLDLTGLKYLDANLERLILYTYPSLVVILSTLVLKQPLTKELLLSLAVIYLGLFVVFSQQLTQPANQGDQWMLGAALVFASACSFAIFLIGSEIMMRTLSSKLFTAIAMLSASAAIVTHYAIHYPASTLFIQATPVYLYGLVIAFFCTVIPSFLVSAGIARVGGAKGSLAGAISPIFTLVLAYIFLDESISLIQAIGFVIVIAGVVYLSRAKQQTS